MRALAVTVAGVLSLVGYGDRVAVAQTSPSSASARITGALNIPPYSPAGSPGRFLPFRAGHVDLCELLTQQEEQRVLSVLRRADEIFRRVPALNPPSGVEVRQYATVGGVTPDQCRRLVYADNHYQIFNLPVYRGAHAPSSMFVYLNPGGRRWANVNNPYFEDEQGPVYFERQQTGTVNGSPVFGEFVIGRGGWKPVHVFVSAVARPFWIPVSRERVLRSAIAKQREAVRVTGDPQSPYQAWLRDAPRRQADREAALRGLVGLMRSDSIAALRRAMEQTEREVGESLRADDGQLMASAADGQRHMRSNLADLERELAAMSPAQRVSQAWISNEAPTLSFLVPAGTAYARPLVAPNPDFYDRTRPPTDVQAMLVEFRTAGESRYALALTGAVFRSLDWAGLAALLTR